MKSKPWTDRTEPPQVSNLTPRSTIMMMRKLNNSGCFVHWCHEGSRHGGEVNYLNCDIYRLRVIGVSHFHVTTARPQLIRN